MGASKTCKQLEIRVVEKAIIKAFISYNIINNLEINCDFWSIDINGKSKQNHVLLRLKVRLDTRRNTNIFREITNQLPHFKSFIQL